jgi:hypothetical protein
LLVVLFGMLRGQRMPGWTALFLVTTVLTTVTGFMFPITAFTPALGTGIVSSVVLLVALVAIYVMRLRGAWRWTYVAGAVTALYLNVFVLIVQSFQKIPAVNALAPTQAETPFLVAQVATLAVFVLFGLLAAMKFRFDRTAVR